MSEVRVKLHADIQAGVQNVWMSLNYDKKPTIGHIISHLRKNYNCDAETVVNLYLDEFWLPPWENSRLLRENDCIKLEIIVKPSNEQANFSTSPTKSLTTTIPSTNFHEAIKQNLNEQTKLKEKTNLKSNDLNLKHSNQQQRQQQQEKQQKDNQTSNFLLNSLNQQSQTSSNASTTSSSSTQSTPKTEKINNNKQKAANNQKPKNQTPYAKSNNNTAATNNNLNKNTKMSINIAAHKRFGVGNYALLLNEDNKAIDVDNDNDSNEQEENNEVKERDFNNKDKKTTTIGSYNNNIELIAQSINATAKSKWKNSNNVDKQQNSTTTPKHIRFESSSEDSSSSSSSSSSEDENDTCNKKENGKSQAKQVNNNNNNIAAKKPSPKQQQKQQPKKQQNNWKPLNKEEQLNMVNYNRSYTVQTPESLDQFVKVFNKTKLNPPVNGDENENKIEEKVEKKEKELIEFNKLDSFSGVPSSNDRIAFQIVEISSNFTPELSDYKTGTILSYDEKTNDVTLRLNGSSYNEVLNRPNKFTIVEEEEYEDEKDYGYRREYKENTDEDDILTIDWTSLINVKKMKSDAKKQQEQQDIFVDLSEPQQQQQQQKQQDQQETQNLEENLVKEDIKSDQLQK